MQGEEEASEEAAAAGKGSEPSGPLKIAIMGLPNVVSGTGKHVLGVCGSWATPACTGGDAVNYGVTGMLCLLGAMRTTFHGAPYSGGPGCLQPAPWAKF